MKPSIFDKISNLFILMLLLYCGLFIIYHFASPDIGDIDITISSNPTTQESQMISISTSKLVDRYYLLVYADSKEDYWMYFSPSNYVSDGDTIKNKFLFDDKKKFILLEGNAHRNNFSFTLNSKYPLSYIANKEHVFHVYYIVPYKFFIFPTFYYSKHYIFFIDSII